jgi:peptidoglycan/xylan/chitin deacetylase (PgdA/CDA1 family)
MALAATLAWAGCRGPEPPQLIAVTLDDAPLMHRNAYPGPFERAQTVDSLVSALTTRGVPATVFAIGQDLENEEDRALLARWSAAGFMVGNHSYTHRSFDELTPEEGRREILRTREKIHEAITPISSSPYFRFPFLEEGETPEVRASWMAMLDSLGMIPARVTITTDDWRYDARYEEAELAEDWESRYEIGQEYLAHVLQSVQFWDDVARDLYGRQVQHVLMLHANRINRDYLGPILDALAGSNHQFVSLDRAYRDALFQEDVNWTSTNGMSFLEHVKQDRIRQGTYPAP